MSRIPFLRVTCHLWYRLRVECEADRATLGVRSDRLHGLGSQRAQIDRLALESDCPRLQLRDQEEVVDKAR